MNYQEYFDTVVTHLLTQNKQAGVYKTIIDDDGEEITDANITCLYRAPDGTKCAAGCMIPDELYVKEMEEKTISLVCDKWPELKPYFPNIDLAMKLQWTHDCCQPENWKEKLRARALQYKLSPAVIDQFEPKEQA